jgi:hypothetical protein
MLKDRRRTLTYLLLTILIFQILSIAVFASEIDKIVQVTLVIDGDSFEVSGDEVRLADVSAPEWNMPGGTEATNALFNLISGEIVYLDTDQKSGRDPYGRLIAVVYIKHNSTHYKNVNEALLRLGVVSEDDYTNNEFSPSTWALFVRYASIEPPPPPLPTPSLPPFLSDLTVTPSELERGDNVTISLDIMNPNNQSIIYIVTIRVEGIGQMGAHIEELTLFVDVELGAYESETVQHTITPDVAGHYNVTVDGMTGSFVVVRPPLPANFVVLDLYASPDEVEEGENVTFGVRIINDGDTEGTYTVEFKVDGETIYTQNVTLAADSSHHVRAYYEAKAGAYHAVTHLAPHQVSVGDLAETFMVRVPLEPAEFEFSNLSQFISIEEDMDITFFVDVSNVGDIEGTYQVVLILTGGDILFRAEYITDVTLPGGASEKVPLWIHDGLKAGAYQVEVEGLIGSFTVVKPEPSFWDKIPGFPYESIIIGLIAVIIIIWRARNF